MDGMARSPWRSETSRQSTYKSSRRRMHVVSTTSNEGKLSPIRPKSHTRRMQPYVVSTHPDSASTRRSRSTTTQVRACRPKDLTTSRARPQRTSPVRDFYLMNEYHAFPMNLSVARRNCICPAAPNSNCETMRAVLLTLTQWTPSVASRSANSCSSGTVIRSVTATRWPRPENYRYAAHIGAATVTSAPPPPATPTPSATSISFSTPPESARSASCVDTHRGRACWCTCTCSCTHHVASRWDIYRPPTSCLGSAARH